MTLITLLLYAVALLYVFTSEIQLITKAQVIQNSLVIHIIPHSHCDPGWLNTFEGYYMSDVHLILDNVLAELQKSRERRFVWSETSYFHRWYENLSLEKKRQFKQLVKNEQLEFVNGGWSQHDEANPHPTEMLNQLTLGHSYLKNNFGIVPKVAWQIDPFGHSSATPFVMKMAGFEALVINRIHFSLKDQFKTNRHMEFLWNDLLTHVLHTHYSAPAGFDWEENSRPVDGNNVVQRANELVSMMRQRALAFRTKHLLVPFGDDFKFKNAAKQFDNMDRLISYINSHPELGVHIQYSTASEYFDALSNSEVAFPTFEGDFYPYADNGDSYWTGYFTTRPLLKHKSRTLSSALRASEVLYAVVRGSPKSQYDSMLKLLPQGYWESKYQDLETARMESSLFLHHDAITGTSKQMVVVDYLNRMDRANDRLQALMCRMIEHMVAIEPNPPKEMTHVPFTLNYNPNYAEQIVPYTVYNSLGWIRKELLTVKVSTRAASVYDSDGKTMLKSQIDPFFAEPSDISTQKNQFILRWIGEIPPLGAKTFFVKLTRNTNEEMQSSTIVYTVKKKPLSNSKYVQTEQLIANTELRIANDYVEAFFSPETGLLQSIKLAARSFSLNHSYRIYRTSHSGAYLFRPEGHSELRFNPKSLPEDGLIRIVKGPVFQSVFVNYHSFEIEYGLIQSDDPLLSNYLLLRQTVNAEVNTELLSVFSTSLNTKEFYTHTGLHWMRRIRREKPIASNFYPMVAGARLIENQLKLSIITAHSMSIGSNENGELECVVHRYLNQDDGRGLGEPVQDDSRIRIDFKLLFQIERDDFEIQSIRTNNKLMSFYAVQQPFQLYKTADEWLKTNYASWSALAKPLPQNLHLFSLMVRDSVTDDVGLRLFHLGFNEGKLNANELFTSELELSELRRTTGTFLEKLSSSGQKLQLWSFKISKEQIGEITVVSRLSPQSRQNTDEEGVFISQAALDAQAAQKKTMQPNRRLMLFGLSQNAFMMKIEPQQIQSYCFRLWGKETENDLAIIRENEKLHLAQLAQKNVDHTPSATEFVDSKDLESIQSQKSKLNHDDSTLHELIGGVNPEHDAPKDFGHELQSQKEFAKQIGSEAIKKAATSLIQSPNRRSDLNLLIPSRTEYIVVLLMSLVVVLFFMATLGFFACEFNFRGNRRSQSTKISKSNSSQNLNQSRINSPSITLFQSHKIQDDEDAETKML